MNFTTLKTILCTRLLLLSTGMAFIGVAGCGGSGGGTPAPPVVNPPQALTVSGVITDGPVSGGTLYVFAAAQVQAALSGAASASDRVAALNAATSIVSVSRDVAANDQYSVSVPGELAGSAVFMVFDNTGATDNQFDDVPANLESVVMLGDAGSSQRANVSMQTTLVAHQVRHELDPDGDGNIIATAAIETAMTNATANVLSAFATDSVGRTLYPENFNPVTHDNDEAVHEASSELGFLVRTAGQTEEVSLDAVVEALAADAADGIFDGLIPSSMVPTPALETLAAGVRDRLFVDDRDTGPSGTGPCTAAAKSLNRACRADIMDDYFEGRAICADIGDNDDRHECMLEVKEETKEKREECPEIFEARLDVCEALDDAAHDPMFGENYAENFVDPLAIGDTVDVNPWFPLVTGNRWVYEGDGETIEVVVTDETKLIEGVTCVVIIDTAREDGVVIEETRDWYAQDKDGNVWYCGEISRNFELFEGDDPEEAELVDIDGSWKAGRDGAEAGILLPFTPQVGTVIRQEVSYGEAEDVIEVLSVSASESSPGGSCTDTCLQTKDYTPLDVDPDAIEHKYYVAGIGLIVEVKPGTDERIELVEFTQLP